MSNEACSEIKVIATRGAKTFFELDVQVYNAGWGQQHPSLLAQTAFSGIKLSGINMISSEKFWSEYVALIWY